MQTINFRPYELDLNFKKNDSCTVAIVSKDYLPAFYLVTSYASISEIKAICEDEATLSELTLDIQTVDNQDGTYTHVYMGGDAMDECGYYHLEARSGTILYYSELFSVQDFTDVQIPYVDDIPTCSDTYTDSRDSKTYGTVVIGNRCWMSQPFRYSEGLTADTDYVHPYNPVLDPDYGLLYSYDAIKAANFLPLGWRLPTEEDFYDLINTIGGLTAGNKLMSTVLWDPVWGPATDEYDFHASGAGYYDGANQEQGDRNVMFCDSIIYPNSFRTYELVNTSSTMVKSYRDQGIFSTVRLVRDVEVQEFIQKKDDLHLPIKFSELLEVNTDNPTKVDRNIMPVILFKTMNETSGVVTISQVSTDGLITLPISVTVSNEVLNGARYYYTTSEVVELECGVFYLEIIDGDHTYYSNVLDICEVTTADTCIAILVDESEVYAIETEKGLLIQMETCVASPYVPELEYALDDDGVEFADDDDELFTIEI